MIRMNNDESVVEVWPKGSCSGPGRGPGGWAAALKWRGTVKILSGQSSGETTPNRMELLAVIKSLEELKRPVRVTVVTNSKYLENGLAQKAFSPETNFDLWMRLSDLCRVHQVSCRWQKAESTPTGTVAAALAAAQREAKLNKENTLVERCEPMNREPDLFGSAHAY